MRGINKVILVATVTRDIELKFMPSGDAMANLSVVTNRSWKDKSSGEQKEAADFHRVVFFKKLAELAGEYLKKGSKVYIEGELRTRKFQDQSGQDRYVTEIVGNELQFLDSKPQGQTQSSAQQPAQGQQAPNGMEDFDDDIPF